MVLTRKCFLSKFSLVKFGNVVLRAFLEKYDLQRYVFKVWFVCHRLNLKYVRKGILFIVVCSRSDRPKLSKYYTPCRQT